MTKRTIPKDDPEQSKRFEDAARALEADGGLSPADAEAALAKTMAGVAKLRRQWLEGEEDPESPP
jgi:hypothetical protein